MSGCPSAGHEEEREPEHDIGSQQLNAFQPHRLYGYSSSLSDLADLAIQGKLQIHPVRVFVAGDKLFESMERKIREAWHVPIHVTYGASESKYIAIKESGQDEMSVLDELNIVEVLDEHNRPVLSGQEGRVVLTNLQNYTLPVIRYEVGDYVLLGRTNDNSSAATIRDIRGRVNDALPVVLRDGTPDTIHPIILSEFHVPTLERIQFVSKQPERVWINYVAPSDLSPLVTKQFQQILDSKGATQTQFEVQRLQQIDNDRLTGGEVRHAAHLDIGRARGRRGRHRRRDLRQEIGAVAVRIRAVRKAARASIDSRASTATLP